MTSHVGRLYAIALALVLFFVVWVAVAARPWVTAAPDPRPRALQARELKLRAEARLVDRVVARRWAVYRKELGARNAQIALARRRAAQAPVAAVAAPAVRVVTLPPLTITRTS